MTSRSPLRPEEEWARQMIEAELSCPVVQHDDGTDAGMFDLRIEYPNRSHGAVEVVGAPDPLRTRLWNTANGGGGRHIIDGIAGGWNITLGLDAHVKSAKAALPTLLRMLESQNVRAVRRHDKSNEAVWARQHGIVQAIQFGTDFPGSVYFSIDLEPGEMGGWVQPNPGVTLPTWVSNLLAMDHYADVPAKLRASGLAERHAFVLVPFFALEGSFDLIDALWRSDVPLPSTAPELPDGIDQVWIVGTMSDGTGYRRAPSPGWTRFDKLQPSDGVSD